MADNEPGTVLDWRTHQVGAEWGPNRGLEPCRLCGHPAMLRDEQGQPCHKACAEGGTRPAAAAPTRPTEPADARKDEPTGPCCGRDAGPGQGEPVAPRCKLCPVSPTYWRAA